MRLRDGYELMAGDVLGALISAEETDPMEHYDRDGVTAMLRTLIALLVVALAGFAAARLRMFLPKADHTYAMVFYVEKLALPAVVFKESVSRGFDHVSPNVVVTCTLAKLIGMLCVWSVTFLLFQIDRSMGKRVITATILSSTITLTSDFAIGMPMLQSLNGSLSPAIIDTTDGMNIYLVVNALIQSVLFNPVTRGLIHYGKSLDRTNQPDDSSDIEDNVGNIISILVHVGRSPILLGFLAGMTWRHLLGWSLVKYELEMGSVFYTFDGLLDFITSAYVVSSVFLMGACMDCATFTPWALFIVIVKMEGVPVVGRFMYLFMKQVVDPGVRKMGVFTFFYGALPTSFDTYYLAKKYDGRSRGIVSSCILFSMILAGPELYSSVTMVSKDQHIQKPVYRAFYSVVDCSGLVCLVIIMLIISFFVRQHWGFSCKVKQLLACYILFLFVYLSLSLAINPSWNDQPCKADAHTGFYRSPILVMYGIFQSSSYLAILALQAYSIFCPVMSSSDSYEGYSVACTCFVLGCIAGLAGQPNGYKELCEDPSQTSFDVDLRLSWMSIRFLISIGLFITMLVKRMKDVTNIRSALGKRKTRIDLSCDIAQRSTWTSQVPFSLIQTLALQHLMCAGLQFLMSLAIKVKMVQKGHVLRPKKSFCTIILGDVLLDHGQAMAMLFALIFDDGFLAAIWEGYQDMFGSEPEQSENEKEDLAGKDSS